MIYNCPDPPPGSKIAVEPDAYELRLSWGSRRTAPRLVLSVVGSIAMAFTGVAMSLIGSSRMHSWALTFIIMGLLVGFLVTLLKDYRALRPEMLLLGMDSLTHTAGGKNSAAAPVHTAPFSFRVWNPRTSREVSRADVRELGPGERDGKAFVTMEVAGGVAREIGWGLRDADREWLVTVLERWKESPA